MSSTQYIIKDQAVVEDHYRELSMDCPIPEGDIIVPYQRWVDQHEILSHHNGRVGVSVNGNDYDIYEIGAKLAQFDLVALEFPQFVDGRCYSFAKLLRERFGYTGELRAIGNVLRDQIFYMHRCGINSFALDDGRSFDDAMTAFKDFSSGYQDNYAL
ncbi:conserved hypothetical protein [gamma proteobacterium HTCC5015]|nr:conserved hypothetical protein [gamma proteobacterium HTCC5015]